MAGLGENLMNLAGMKRSRATVMANLAEPLRLKMVAPSGSNPGELRMLTYVPPGLPEGAPLVVVLHGCTQNAAAYDHGSGWSVLAERHGFAVLFPEQQRSNNGNLCFNWFHPEDVAAGHGEVESIRQMTEQMVAAHRIDRRRVFITGLSAGGAMTAAVLATAPSLFAGGAVIAGLPYGSANSVQQALQQMHQPVPRAAREWGARVRQATGHGGRWPAVQVWHGEADPTVVPANAEALVRQWRDVMGLGLRPDASTTVEGVRHDVWRDAAGRAALELWLLPGFGHGTPVGVSGEDADGRAGVPGPHMLEAPVDATWQLARSWGLLTQAPLLRPARAGAAGPGAPGLGLGLGTGAAALAKAGAEALAGPGSVIEKALKASGLLR